MPSSVVRVAESGIHSGADIAQLRSAGYDAFLIGESLMNQSSPGDALRSLIAEAGDALDPRTSSGAIPRVLHREH
jgi:indole-3-glycerol phosphate synthase